MAGSAVFEKGLKFHEKISSTRKLQDIQVNLGFEPSIISYVKLYQRFFFIILE